jgi:hypothetical protein
MRRAKLGFLVVIAMTGVSVSIVTPTAAPQKKGLQSRLRAYRNNSCVTCHADLSEPLHTSAHFYEWLGSEHEKKGVGCEKCHGGNPAAAYVKTAHEGMLRPILPQSRLNPKNLPTTCGECHQEAVAAFTRSTHYLKLQDTGTGPTCTTCHHHMATSVITWPPETAALCAGCHNRSGGPAAQSLEVPQRASDVIAAFSRADEVMDWTWFLINEDRKRVRRYKPEQAELKRLETMMKSAKLSWHEFNLSKSRHEADKVFGEATKLKNNLR